jgi:hypothetical protein
MAEDFSWQHAAAEYEKVYRLAYERRRRHPFSASPTPAPATPSAVAPRSGRAHSIPAPGRAVGRTLKPRAARAKGSEAASPGKKTRDRRP